ncbi:DUF1624 domain-containing protein [Leucobacter sp. CSA1]|uniref:DUF1624 domain-containing protein n=1 Tax=Leucobacter chromiisoli TaxID=2796471 RepID=A0A934Q4Q9_9MICO|nr:heparan-alpha-glucosaminide N-acetyltransferase domain-containing protein [Leucobacter chromiisoli]MBK0418319.1 DUF1624 domain-containing protein [Leucobacter chromiisoli]
MNGAAHPRLSVRPAERTRDRLARLEPPARLPGVDLARGLAVLGMFAAHLLDAPRIIWGEPETWLGVVEGRSSILFATLAGVSLALASGGASPPRGAQLRRARLLLAVRAFVVWAIGVLLLGLAVPVYVILPAYGLLFAAGIGMLGLSWRALFALAAVLATVMPFVVAVVDDTGFAELGGDAEAWPLLLGWRYPFPLWAAFLAAGLGAGRLLAAAPVRRATGLVAAGAVLAVTGYGIIGPVGDRAVGPEPGSPGPAGAWFLAVLQDEPHSSGVGEAIGSGGFALAAIGVCVIVGATPLRMLLWPVRVVGSMPLTAYASHLVVWGIWLAGERARTGLADPPVQFSSLDPFWPMTIGVIVGCVLWAVCVGRGPLEACVARLSAGVVGTGREAERRA